MKPNCSSTCYPIRSHTSSGAHPASRRSLWRLLLAFLVSLLGSAAHAHDIIPGAKQDRPILLRNGIIHTVSGENLPDASLLFENGIITRIEKNVPAPPNCDIIDLDGRHVYPGLISSKSTIGLVEIGYVRATRDHAETGKLNTNARSATAINPDSELIPVTRANGVLISHVLPQPNGGTFGGTSSIIALDGWTIEEMALETDAGIHIRWPSSPTEPNPRLEGTPVFNAKKADEKYYETIRKLEEAFDNARAYLKALETSESPIDVNLRWEALVPAIEKKTSVFVTANKLREIKDAIQWSQDASIDIVLITAGDAWRAAATIKAAGIPVIVSEVNALPQRRWESYDSIFTNTVKLHESGIPFAIAYGGGGATYSNERNLPYEAAKAAAHGLPKEEALKAITLYPAQILGIDDRVGSLETGKHATLIVTDGDPLDIRTQVHQAFIQGRSVDLSNRHTQLRDKYEKKYLQTPQAGGS